MSILEKEVLVGLNSNMIKYYKCRGYNLPTFVSEDKKIKLDNTGKLYVKVVDLPQNSTVKVTKICDKCFNIERNKQYRVVLKGRHSNGGDYCKECLNIVEWKKRHANIPKHKQMLTTHLDIVDMVVDKSIIYKLTKGSHTKVDLKCNLCGCINKNKSIYNIARTGFSCERCSDGISYPEKFIIKLLEQLSIYYKHSKYFTWLANRQYDFFIPSHNCIVEAHGEQHYKERFQHHNNSRSLEKEQENDMFKKRQAIENGISNYIEIDCRKSDLVFIKNNILNSKLSILFDLNKIDWKKCHEFTCHSLVKEVCELWSSGIESTKQISNIIKLARSTVIRYLKLGSELGWVTYDPKENMKRGLRRKSREVVQLSLSGKFIKGWKTIKDASENSDSESSSSSISSTCRGTQKTSKGYKWMYKEDYEKYIAEQNGELGILD